MPSDLDTRLNPDRKAETRNTTQQRTSISHQILKLLWFSLALQEDTRRRLQTFRLSRTVLHYKHHLQPPCYVIIKVPKYEPNTCVDQTIIRYIRNLQIFNSTPYFTSTIMRELSHCYLPGLLALNLTAVHPLTGTPTVFR